jgi:hypothetical protein
VLVRFRADRVFFRLAQPRPRGQSYGGRPWRHGTAFRCRDQATWGDLARAPGVRGAARFWFPRRRVTACFASSRFPRPRRGGSASPC